MVWLPPVGGQLDHQKRYTLLSSARLAHNGLRRVLLRRQSFVSPSTGSALVPVMYCYSVYDSTERRVGWKVIVIKQCELCAAIWRCLSTSVSEGLDSSREAPGALSCVCATQGGLSRVPSQLNTLVVLLVVLDTLTGVPN